MVKICVISAEGLKDDTEKKKEGLPDPEILTDIPLYEKLKLETIDDMAVIKTPKRRCKGLAIMTVLAVLAVTCLCLATIVYNISGEKKEQVHEYQEKHRFECEILFREPDDDVVEGVTGQKPETTSSPHYSTLDPHLHHMKEEIIVDVENNTEVFSIPASDEHEAIIMLHDFTHRYTAYLLEDQELCFVKDINPLLLNPFVLMQLLMNPIYFLYEFTASRERFIAVPPPLDSLTNFGEKVDSLCGNVPTFWLEEMDDEYETVDISELPWWDWGYPDRYTRRRRSAVGGGDLQLTYFDGDECLHEVTILFKGPSEN